VEVILRRLVVMRLSGWGFEQAEYLVNDSSVLRQVRRVYLERAPDDTAPIRRANTIGPEAVEKLDSRVVQLARSLKLTRGREPRVDTTAVETDIHSPTDSGPVGDGVRVVSRPLRRAGVAPGEAASGSEEAFRSRVRAVGKLSRPPHRIARRENERGREALKAAYARLVATARRTGLKAKGGSRSSRDMAMTRQLGGRPSDSGRSCLDSSEASGRPSGGPSRMARSPRRRSRSRCSSRTPR
jgi:IS5 family transposase